MIGWRAIHLALTLLALASAAALLPTLPRGVRGAPLSLASWAAVARHRQIVLLLATTALLTTGQFAVFTFVAPIAQRLADAGPAVIGMLFATAGVMGLVGNLLASQVVGRLGVVRTSALAFGVMAVGWLLWALGAGVVPAMVVSLALNGIGFAGVSGLQQARLVTAAPALATGTVALNSATIYVGQAAGSGIGGLMIAHDYYRPLGWIAVAFTLAAIAAFWPTRRADGPPVPVA
jgi:DHA1 family inner membrane transport protein